MRQTRSLILAGLCGLAATRGGFAESPSATTMTLYSTAEPGAVPAEVYRPVAGAGGYQPVSGANLPGYAMIRQERELLVEKGRSTLRFTDVAALIDPTTVTFASLSDPSTRVLEQNFQFDLVDNERLLQRFLDQSIRIEQTRGDTVAGTTGKLLSSSGGVILQHDDGSVEVVNQYSNLRLPQLPGGLITRPTLVWDLLAEKAGPQKVRVSYETGGMTWWTDYNLTFTEGSNANSGTLDVGAWVSILNQSGAGYEDAKLKLVAGKVNRAPRPESAFAKGMRAGAYDVAAAPMQGFEEQGLFEYHLYTLGRPTTLPDRSTKQVELFPVVRNVPCEKVLVYAGQGVGPAPMADEAITDREYGAMTNKEVDTYLRFRNRKEDGLGIPLPAGRIRVSKVDPADGSLEFIGEDRLGHTPREETVQIRLGTAFDVVGERRQVDFSLDSARKTMEEEFEITVRNRKDAPVQVVVKETLPRWSSWSILRKSHEFTKTDAHTIEFPLSVAKDAEAKVNYRVRYTW